MGRRKIEIKAIKDDRNRSVTFLKRKGGLFKKAHELSVLCSVDVAVIIFGHNKKLYEFSSGDINETIGRYQYYGGAHEHKGPGDFNGKKEAGDDDDDDDDNMGSPHPDSHSPPEHHHMIPQLQNQPPYQHIRHHTPSASPPMHNGGFQQQRYASPQPMSRPESRAHIRRSSSNLAPPPPHMHGSQPPQPPAQNYAYMPNPPIYNPQAAAGMPVRGQPGPPGPPSQTPQPPQFQYTHPMPNSQAQQQFEDEQRRASMPPTFPTQQEQRPPATSPPQQPTIQYHAPPQQQPQQQQQSQPQPSPQPEHNQFQSPPLPQPKALSVSAKNHSIFTPIDDSRSLLAQNWGPVPSDLSRAEHPKADTAPRSQSIDTASMKRGQPNGRAPPAPPMTINGPPGSHDPAPPQRTASSSSVPIIQPPSRTNSMKNDPKRPKLNLTIPSEHSEGEGSATSSGEDPANAGVTPVRGPGEGGHTGVVLPPPSPSASALLSAGASGPPNPFARPAPPGSNAFGSNRNDNMETPISALPSRFLADQLLPSPSSFYNDWGFGRDGNMLPSPSNFQTPVVQNGPGLLPEEGEKKRKTSEGSEGGLGKRIKT